MVGVRVKSGKKERWEKKLLKTRCVTKQIRLLESAWKTDPVQAKFISNFFLVERVQVDAENIRKLRLLPNVFFFFFSERIL